MKGFLFSYALVEIVAFIPAILAAAVPFHSGQAGVWRKSFNTSVTECYKTSYCTSARSNWQHCQDANQLNPPHGGSLEARNALVAECLCQTSYVQEQDECLACICNTTGNPCIHGPQTTNTNMVCNKTTTLADYENVSFKSGVSMNFPLILPSLQLASTWVTQPDQILISKN
ncbi:hypothetical protein DSL72_005308 [Monilinia vaccinii-corymbosi]|uniref:Uncharacterized protein n=1 Tax=Monilinia vaccinii-corymbosi TaxID=61207 RepID=A0A8A3PEU1_9HELO|nr:hypothetical protein DSL72_005308 [Monilinia vaccinii-corymbosi]